MDEKIITIEKEGKTIFDFSVYEPKIQSLFLDIKEKQDLFFKENGRYFQTLKTGDISGKESLVDFSRKAIDEEKEIPAIEFNDTLPFEIQIDKHFNPET